MKIEEKKGNSNNLYVASVIWESLVEYEPWVQYESHGKLQHNLIVSRKRVLVYSETDENGNTKYYNYKTGKEVKICEHTHNYLTKSNYQISILSYLSSLHGVNLLFPKLSYDYNIVGFLVPFDDFSQEKIGINSESLSVTQKFRLLNFYNLFAGKPFYLKDNIEESEEIIQNKLGYKFGEQAKKIK